VKRAIAIAIALSLAALTAGACTSGVDEAVLAALGGECLLDSDCDEALVCVFEQCHQPCATSADCSNGARCVVGEPTVHACELAPDATCAKNTDCPGVMVCGPDAACRDACVTSADCLSDQVCTRDRVCALPSELEDGELPQTLKGDACLLSSDCVAPQQCFAGICRLECETAADCASGVCEANVCAPPVPGGPICIPNHQQKCACDDGGAGVEICDSAGLGYGDCLGCAPPGKLGCYTPTNPDPDVHYALGLPANPGSFLSGAAMLDDGSLILGGSFDSITIDGVPLTPVGLIDALVFQLSSDGSSIDWLWTYGLPGEALSIVDVIRTSTGDIVALGSYGATTPDFGFGALPTGPGMFVIRFDAAGVLQASRGFQGNFGIGFQATMVAAPDGGVIIASEFSNTVDVGSGVLGTGWTSPSGLLLKLDSSLDHVFSHGWGDASYGQTLSPSVTFGQNGDLILAGTFAGSVDFGLGPTPSNASSRIFVAKYSPAGVPIVAEVFEGTAAAAVFPRGLRADANGDLHLGGEYNDGVDFGTGPLAGMGAFEVTLDGNAGLIAVESQPNLKVTSYTANTNGAIIAGYAQGAPAFDIAGCNIDSLGSPWPVLYHRANGGSIDWVRTYELLVGSIALPRRVVSNSAGRTAVVLQSGPLNNPISLDIGGIIVNGRFAVFTIDP